MSLRTPLATAAVVALTVAAVPATASAAKSFRGKSQQNRTVQLTVGDDNLLQSAQINWITRRCAKSGARFQHITRFRTPFDVSSPDDFADAAPFTVRDRGRIRSRVTLSFAGHRTFDPANPAGERWDGTLKANVVVRRRGRVIDRCRLRQITWTATLLP